MIYKVPVLARQLGKLYNDRSVHRASSSSLLMSEITIFMRSMACLLRSSFRVLLYDVKQK